MKHIALLFVSVVILTSCQKEDIKPQESDIPEDYFPYIKVGNKWVYDFNYDGQVLDSLIREITTEEEGIFGGYLKDKTTSANEFFFVEGNKLMYFFGNNTKEDASLISRTDISQGDQWYRLQYGDSVQVDVVTLDTMITCPAGEFQCSRLKETNLRTKEIVHTMINPDFGMIAMMFRYQGKPMSYTLRKKNF